MKYVMKQSKNTKYFLVHVFPKFTQLYIRFYFS